MKIGTIYDITFATNRADTGALSDADSTPVVRVTENGVNLAYLPTVSNLSTGVYLVSIDASLANGFEVGKRYSVYVTATVNSINGANGLDSFTIETRSIDDVLPTASYTTPPTVVAIRTEIDSNSAKLDVAISSRLSSAGYTAPDNSGITAIKLKTDQLIFTGANLHSVAKLVEDKTGYALTSGERTAIAVAVEQAILNEGDGQAILNAIVGAIGNQNIDEIALVAAIRADMERNGGMLDAVPTLTEIEASSILAKESTLSGKASQASVSAIPTNPLLTNDVRLDHLDADISSVGGGSGGGGLTAEEHAHLMKLRNGGGGAMINYESIEKGLAKDRAWLYQKIEEIPGLITGSEGRVIESIGLVNNSISLIINSKDTETLAESMGNLAKETAKATELANQVAIEGKKKTEKLTHTLETKILEDEIKEETKELKEAHEKKVDQEVKALEVDAQIQDEVQKLAQDAQIQDEIKSLESNF